MSRLQDNQELLKVNPQYLANLKALSQIERERLLHGNWKIKAAAGLFFKRAQLGNILEMVPADVTQWVRCWDLAATEKTEHGDPAYTAGVLIGKRKNGRYVVADVINKQMSASDVRSTIKLTAQADRAKYGRVVTRLPKDPGQAGKEQAESYIKFLQGFIVKTVAESGSKESRAEAKREEMLTKLYNNELCGATLGSQESQDFALVVPNKVDHLVKDAERIKEYIRYMDDGFAGHKSKQRLRELLGKMEVAAKQQGLTLNMKKTRITKSSRGFTFLKVRYIVTETGKIIKKMVKSGIVRMRRKLKKYRSLVDQGRMSLDDVFASVKSWFGNATKIGKTYRARKAILCLYNKLFKRYRTGGMLA